VVRLRKPDPTPILLSALGYAWRHSHGSTYTPSSWDGGAKDSSTWRARCTRDGTGTTVPAGLHVSKCPSQLAGAAYGSVPAGCSPDPAFRIATEW